MGLDEGHLRGLPPNFERLTLFEAAGYPKIQFNSIINGLCVCGGIIPTRGILKVYTCVCEFEREPGGWLLCHTPPFSSPRVVGRVTDCTKECLSPSLLKEALRGTNSEYEL